jgi:divalent metal cation (Fe/Co/Zn/Cd) transporter
MNKAFSLAILIAGVILIIYGISASNSAGSSLSRLANGAPTDKAIWLLVGGSVLSVIGLAGVLRGTKAN